MAIEYILLVGPILILISIAIARFSDNLGVPTMLLFLGIGMLAGFEGPGGIQFDDPALAQSVGIIALVFILFAGGLETNWSLVRPALWQTSSLATLGVLLTTLAIGLIQLLTNANASVGSLALHFIVQMGLGAAFGYGVGKAMVFFLNHLKLAYEGIYPVFSQAFAALVYGATTSIGGSGFLAVYIAGLVASNTEFVHKKSLLRFFDGLAWLSQITMFVTLGLLVFPSQIIPILGLGLLVSGFLMLVARPLSVFISLSLSKFQWREKAFISWVGLRGAVPIVLATFPLLAGLPDAQLMFNLVFFIVLTSAMFQGWSIPSAARFFNVDAPPDLKRRYPLEFSPVEGVNTELVDLIYPYNSSADGKPIVELGMPPESLIVLISRSDNFLVPSGGSVLQEGDTVLVLVNKNNLP